jgi:hypothetical protein
MGIIGYLQGAIAERQAEPKDDFITELLHSEHDGEPIGMPVVMGMCALLLIAGIDTTWSSIGSTMWHLATHPEDRRRLKVEPELMPTAIEEFLRAYAPVTMARRLVEDTEYNGCPMKAGERVLMNFPAANRDPEVFPDANTSRSVPASTAVLARTSPAWSCGWRWRSGCAASPSSRSPTTPRSHGRAARCAARAASRCASCPPEPARLNTRLNRAVTLRSQASSYPSGVTDMLSLSTHLPEVTIGAGDVLVAEGAPSEGLWVLVSGALDVRKGDVVVNTITLAGALVGEMSELLGRHPMGRRSSTVTRPCCGSWQKAWPNGWRSSPRTWPT